MPDYTHLNNVPVARIHKHNAATVYDESEDMVKYYSERLLILAAMAPHSVDDGGESMTWADYVQGEVREAIEGLLEDAHKSWAAQYIIDNPDECDDELERGNGV